jgi:hypothetical protein
MFRIEDYEDRNSKRHSEVIWEGGLFEWGKLG